MRSSHTRSLEQNPYGLIQSILNKLGFPRDRAYGSLKAQSGIALPTRVLDIFLLALLVVPALILTTLSGLVGKGATMTLDARRI